MNRAALIVGALLAAPAASAAALVDPAALAAVSPPPFARAPMQAPFRDQHARSVTLAELAAGRPLVLIPVQHQCRNLCGLTLADVHSALAGQALTPGANFEVVALGIDPRETPADAAQSAARLGGADAPGVAALVGDAASDAAVTQALGYRYTWIAATGQYAHMAAIAVLTADGRLVRWLPGLGVKPAALQAALHEAEHGDAPGLGDEIRLLCFHFDPSSGRYTLAIWRLIQCAAGMTATLVALGVGVAFWWERRRSGPGAAA
ncbi:MAG TPA: hypothetical protein VGL58_21125 [Caulobacteraceae bacterium]